MKSLYETILDTKKTEEDFGKSLVVVMDDVRLTFQKHMDKYLHMGYPIEDSGFYFNGEYTGTLETSVQVSSGFWEAVDKFISQLKKKYTLKITRNKKDGNNVYVQFTDYPNPIKHRGLDQDYLYVNFCRDKYDVWTFEAPKIIIQ